MGEVIRVVIAMVGGVCLAMLVVICAPNCAGIDRAPMSGEERLAAIEDEHRAHAQRPLSECAVRDPLGAGA